MSTVAKASISPSSGSHAAAVLHFGRRRDGEDVVHPGVSQDKFVANLGDTMLAVARSTAFRAHDTPLRFELDRGISYSPIQGRATATKQLQELTKVRSQLGDVELSVERYARQDEHLQRLGLPTPAVTIGKDVVPVDLGIDSWTYAPKRSVDGLLRAFVRAPGSLQTDLVAPASAEKGFKRGLQRFLKNRLFPAEPVKSTLATGSSGYMFEVTTNTAGLRVHYSPAYFLTPRRVFGLPSTPVRAPLQPGRYIFGAYPPDVGYWSTDEYDVPGTTTAHLDV